MLSSRISDELGAGWESEQTDILCRHHFQVIRPRLPLFPVLTWCTAHHRLSRWPRRHAPCTGAFLLWSGRYRPLWGPSGDTPGSPLGPESRVRLEKQVRTHGRVLGLSQLLAHPHYLVAELLKGEAILPSVHFHRHLAAPLPTARWRLAHDSTGKQGTLLDVRG